MKSETGTDTFTRTRHTWLTLSGAGLLWVGVCVWAFSVIEFGAIADMPNGAGQAVQTQEQARLAQIDAEEKTRLNAQAAAADQRQQATEAEATRLASLALEVEEQARLEAQGNASERRRIAAAEEARLAAQAKAVIEAKLAAEAKVAEEARVAEQERVREQTEARQRATLASQRAEVNEAARRAAAAEASRIATLARQQRSSTSAKDRELGALVGLSSRLQFAPGSATVSRQTERILDDIFNPLYLYSEASILVSIATNEYDGTTNDGLLSRDRGRAIASYLINRGLEKERFRIHIESGEELSGGTHRVRVSAEEVRK